MEEQSSGNLHPSEYRTFWIRWEEGRYSVGRGEELGTDMILQWTDDQGVNFSV